MFSIIRLIDRVELIIEILLFIRVVLSWVGPNFNNSFTDLVYSLTEPLLKPFRSILNLGNLYIDLSPILLIIIMRLLKYFLIRLIILF